MLAILLAAAMTTPATQGAALIEQHQVRAAGIIYDCGTVTNIEVSGYGQNSALLEFVIDGRAYYLATTETLPQVFASFSNIVSSSLTSKQPIKVGWQPDSKGNPIVHFIDFPIALSDSSCRTPAPPPPPPN